jgi:hypothetical protein
VEQTDDAEISEQFSRSPQGCPAFAWKLTEFSRAHDTTEWDNNLYLFGHRIFR